MKLAKHVFGPALGAAVLSLVASAANAELIFNGVTFTVNSAATGTANQYLISYQAVVGGSSSYIGNSWVGASLQMESGAPNWGISSFAVYQNGSDVTNTSSGFFSAYGKIGADEGGCEDTGTQNAVCLQYNGLDENPVTALGAPVIGSGDTLLWTFLVTFDSAFNWMYIPNLKFLTLRYNENNERWHQNGGLVSLPYNVPEPGTLALMGLGLLGLGIGARRRKI